MTICDRIGLVVVALVLAPIAATLADQPAVRSRSNVFGGSDYVLRDGGRLEGRPNALGGQTVRGPTGTIRSRPNALGGMTYELPDGGRAESRSNNLGGSDVELPDGRVLRCRPNALGGTDCRGNP